MKQRLVAKGSLKPHPTHPTMPPFTPTHPIPPKWLRGGNRETLYAKTLARSAPAYRRELITDSFGADLVAYDFYDAPNAQAPCIVQLHGLEGSSRSHYAVELAHAAHTHGWHSVTAHFRSCGGVSAQRMYHSGDTPELAHMLAQLAQRYATLYVVGVSLGGNVLAKYLGEQGNAALPRAAATVSTPFNLTASAQALQHGIPYLLYTPYFLRTLLKKVPASPRPIRSLGAFDDAYTAPMHGYTDRFDYYHRASSQPHLKNIAIPTLLINAQNDPFYPATYLPQPRDISPSVQLLQPQHGGHAGFVSGSGRGHLRWLPQTLLAWFDQFEAA